MPNRAAYAADTETEAEVIDDPPRARGSHLIHRMNIHEMDRNMLPRGRNAFWKSREVAIMATRLPVKCDSESCSVNTTRNRVATYGGIFAYRS